MDLDLSFNQNSTITDDEVEEVMDSIIKNALELESVSIPGIP